jgi:hypothetical protein
MSDNDDADNSEPAADVVEVGDCAQRVTRGTNALDIVLRDSSQPTQRPNRMAADVWAVMREYVEGGGLLDLAEDVAALSALEQEVRVYSDAEDPEISKKDKVDAIIKIVEKRGRLKELYLKMHKERQNFITFEMFSMFLEDLFQILNQHIKNPALLQEIGEDLAEAAQIMRRRINGG